MSNIHFCSLRRHFGHSEQDFLKMSAKGRGGGVMEEHRFVEERAGSVHEARGELTAGGSGLLT